MDKNKTKKNVLDLFSGTGSVSKYCMESGKDYEVISVDIDAKLSNPTFKTDIMAFDYKNLFPSDHFDIIWASPPCVTFSKLQNTFIGRNGITKETIIQKREKLGLPLLRKCQEIIEYFKPRLWFIENPKSSSIKEYLVGKDYYDVDYCKYSDFGYKKSTRIWTNRKDFKPLTCNWDCENMDFDHMALGGVKRHKYDVTGRRFGKGKGNNLARKYTYRVPQLLIKALFED